ncbi:hypothetical protein WL71_21075 [Burkholderia ubonensis]|uniref:Uncharacterized protein n=1 Tax=Burkholderia ubonensis TaxID=101571 RepID=A0A107ERU0_9BURK|nr:hypothetical protein WL71_21075 [Burkholderia ubonensis]KWD86028.1 hypothetical protein WL70_11455 [Burkholderia ubonensis]KWE02976.1 hypothetical protein WL72_08230 [Burkholderia ubonensis]KWE09522.1 hypothetical protein WL73_05030 [Burkholderia ubonensis]
MFHDIATIPGIDAYRTFSAAMRVTVEEGKFDLPVLVRYLGQRCDPCDAPEIVVNISRPATQEFAEERVLAAFPLIALVFVWSRPDMVERLYVCKEIVLNQAIGVAAIATALRAERMHGLFDKQGQFVAQGEFGATRFHGRMVPVPGCRQ